MKSSGVRICECGQPATCVGAYEMRPFECACDDCCGHGCEDGVCYPLGELSDERVEELLAAVETTEEEA